MRSIPRARILLGLQGACFGEIFANSRGMSNLVFVLSFSLLTYVGFGNSTQAVGSSQGEESSELSLSQSAKDEIQVITRISQLREATSRLPQAWTHEVQLQDNKTKIIKKADLLKFLQEVELRSAKRWDVLIRNLATLKTPVSRLSEEEILIRQDAQKLPEIHKQLNKKLDLYNATIKDGILMNLANGMRVGSPQN